MRSCHIDPTIIMFQVKGQHKSIKYEALIAGIQLGKEIGMTNLHSRNDSQIITNLIKGEYYTMES